MNIAIFSDTYLPQINGVVTSMEMFREALEKKGHNVYIFAPQIRGKKLQDDANVFRFASTTFLFQPEYRISLPYSRAINKFAKLNIDIIHSQTPFTMGLLAVYLAKRHNIPLVHTYHTLFSEYVHYLPIPTDYSKQFAIWVSKSYCNVNQLIIAPTEQIKAELIKYNVTTPIEVIPTGINITDVHKVQTKIVEDQFKLTKDKIYLSTISRLGKEKNVPFLLNAFKLVHDVYPNTGLIIMGDGPERKALEREATKLGIRDNIVFTGYIDRTQVFPLLKVSTVFVFASKTETQGLVILEAMSMKKPVVAIDAMGVSSVLEDNQGGYLTHDDPTHFSQCVIALLSNPETYEQKCIEAYKKATDLSANKMARKLINCYKSLLPSPK